MASHVVSSTTHSDVQFRILGPLEVTTGSTPVPIPSGRQQTILGLLLLDANRVVSGDRLVDAVWHGDPPPTARSQIQNCVSALRQIFRNLGVPNPLVTSPPGYLMHVPGLRLDVAAFEQLVARAEQAEHRDQPADAVGLLNEALALWRGPVLGGEISPLLRGSAVRLDEERLRALEKRIDLELRLGCHRRLIGEVSALVEEHPLREGLRGLLMLALYRCGRPGEALDVYSAGREISVAELGLEPGKELKRLHAAILAEDDTLQPESGKPRPEPRPAVTPHQLPADVADFVGQQDALETAESVLLGGAGEQARAARILMITGKAGAGKTALAIHLAHRIHADHFPDGQLYCNFAGMRGSPAAPGDVLARFLRALGLPGSAIPEELDERAKLYRSLLNGRRMLVVLDDVTAENQIVPLLPGRDDCAVIVTSRARLTGIPGARQLDIDMLPTEQAVRLIGNVIGAERVDREPAAADVLAEQVGGLPLAVRIVAVRLAARPHWSLAAMRDRLADERHRLDELSYGDMGVRASLLLTYDSLSPTAARLFRLLGLVAAESLPAWVAEALLDEDAATSLDALEMLVDTQLLDVVSFDPHGRPRFALHNIIGVFARELLAEHEDDRSRTAAMARVLGGWLAQVEQAHRTIYGGDFTVLRGGAPRFRCPDEHLSLAAKELLVWLDAERENLCLAVGQAADLGLTELSWELAVSLVTLFEAHSYFDEWQQTHDRALRAVRRAGNRRGEAALLCSLGSLQLSRNRLPAARAALQPALAVFDEIDDAQGLAMTWRNLALLHYEEGDPGRSGAAGGHALEGFRQLGDLVGQAHVLGQLARVALHAGDYDLAVDRLNTALAICREVGFARVEAQILLRLGEVLYRRRWYDQAKLVIDIVLDIVRRDGDAVGESCALHMLGLVRAGMGSPQEGERLFRAAIDIRDRILDVVGTAQVNLDLAELLRERRALDEATTLVAHALRTFRDRKLPLWEARARTLFESLNGTTGQAAAG